MIEQGLRKPASTSRQRRVSRSFRSIGWYASVTPEIATTCGFQLRRESCARRSSGSSCFTRIRVSKSSPLEKPRYSWVGRA